MSTSALLRSSMDMFNKLLSEYEDFQVDSLSSYKALNCATTAWHLTDWVYEEFEKENFSNIGDMRAEFYQHCDDLKTMHDLATGLKHFTIGRPKSNMSGSHLHQGSFDRTFDFSFDVSCLMIEYSNRNAEPINLALGRVVNFWKSYSWPTI